MLKIIDAIEEKLFQMRQEKKYTVEGMLQQQEKANKLDSEMSCLQEELNSLKNVIDYDGNFILSKVNYKT